MVWVAVGEGASREVGGEERLFLTAEASPGLGSFTTVLACTGGAPFLEAFLAGGGCGRLLSLLMVPMI